jgi:phage-related tail protein
MVQGDTMSETPDGFQPCGEKSCMGYVCQFHSLSKSVQDELAKRQARIEALEKTVAAVADCLSAIRDYMRASASAATDLSKRFGDVREALASLPEETP